MLQCVIIACGVTALDRCSIDFYVPQPRFLELAEITVPSKGNKEGMRLRRPQILLALSQRTKDGGGVSVRRIKEHAAVI